MNRVSDGDRSTSLSFLSCGASSAFSRCSSGVPRDRHAVGDVQRLLVGGARVRHPGARPDRLCAVAGRAFVTSVNTPSRPPIAGLSVAPWNKDDMGDGVPRDQLSHNHCDCTDSHCNSHIVTSCMLILVLHSHHKSIGGRLLRLPQAARDGLALCHLSRQDTYRGVPSQGRNWRKVCVRVEGGRSLA